VRHLTAPEIQTLLDAPKPVDWAGIWDRAMLHLTFATGLRVSELTCLCLEDLTLHPHASILVYGKGRKKRCLPLWRQTTAALRAWLAVRAAVPVPELFINARREPMTRAGFRVYPGEARSHGDPDLSIIGCQARICPCPEAQLCADRT
jgi:site-specific recombinase XerD